MDGSAVGKAAATKQSWAFMAERMPKTVALIKEARLRGDGPHLDLCWRRGVQGLEPGWFWAYEAGVSVGLPSVDMLASPAMQSLLATQPGANVLMLREKEVAHGAD
jgi:hypothetical protein